MSCDILLTSQKHKCKMQKLGWVENLYEILTYGISVQTHFSSFTKYIVFALQTKERQFECFHSLSFLPICCWIKVMNHYKVFEILSLSYFMSSFFLITEKIIFRKAPFYVISRNFRAVIFFPRYLQIHVKLRGLV